MGRSGRQQDRSPGPDSPLAATSPANRQPFLTVDAEDLLVVRIKALPLEQDAKPAIAEPASLARSRKRARNASSPPERF